MSGTHLQLLRDAGLVVSRRDGTQVLYRLAGRTSIRAYPVRRRDSRPADDLRRGRASVPEKPIRRS